MHYCHMTDEDIHKLTLPQLNALLERISEKVEFEVKLAGARFGVGVGEDEEESSITTEEDVAMLERLFA